MLDRPANRLIDQTSPYLRQHAYNPVDWYPWGEPAREAAGSQDKPILLSIGYSACHWCHVMERESFEDETIAALMNELFINIKVDREERPDLDAIYMNYVQLSTGQGGWPLTVFLTPDLLPFYGGTYFPPHDHFGRPGFSRVLKSVARFYTENRGKIEEGREELVQRLSRSAHMRLDAEPRKPEDLFQQAFYGYLHQLDNQYGGFGQAPKFPSAMGLSYLLRYYRRSQTASALEAVVLTLDAMSAGGIYDQIGGGFHRYSVDHEWLVPHFEKMLYDNALLAMTYLEAYQVTDRSRYRRVAEQTLRYLLRDMCASQGGFFSAEDADSAGEEGKFYVWTAEEIREVLAPDAELFGTFYDVSETGNWEAKTILRQVMSLDELSTRFDLAPEEAQRRLDAAAAKLLEARSKRVRPGLDDKILASWNGLALQAFARAAAVWPESEFEQAAMRNADFLNGELIVDGRVLRSWKDGKARLNGYLDDYAELIAGFIAVFELTGEAVWLERAVALQEKQLELFYDDQEGDFFFTADDHEQLLVRHKEFFDNATPSGNSTSARNLLKLALLMGEARYREIAERMLENASGALNRYPLGFGNWLQALDFYAGPAAEIAIVGPARSELVAEVHSRFLPNSILVHVDEASKDLAKKIPLLEGKQPDGGQATAYVCENYRCRQPVTDPTELARLLD